ncbi:MAG: hypothetical protein WD577_08695 [Bacteroidales bacterium]
MRVAKEWFLDNFTLNLYLDVQNLYNYRTTGTEFLVQQFENGRPVIENLEAPMDQQRYELEPEKTEVGTLLPSVGVILKF